MIDSDSDMVDSESEESKEQMLKAFLLVEFLYCVQLTFLTTTVLRRLWPNFPNGVRLRERSRKLTLLSM